MGYAVLERRPSASQEAASLARVALPPGLRHGLERWVGTLWSDWPAPSGEPKDAAFKRALWRRIRDWRRGV